MPVSSAAFHMPRRVLALAAPAILVVIAVSAPGARAAWTAPMTVSTPHDAIGGIQAAAGPGGDLLAWQYDELLPAAGELFAPPGAAYATAGAGGGAFGPQRSRPAAYATSSLVSLGSGLSGGRVAQLILRRTSVGTTEPQVALGSVNGVFAAPIRINASVWAARASLAGNSRGELLLAWITSLASGQRQVWVSARQAGGHFGKPQLISGSADAQQVTAAIGGPVHRTEGGAFAADMVVAFPSRNGRLLASVRGHGQTWGPVQAVGAAAVGNANDIAINIARNGRIVLAWYHQQLSEGGPLGPGLTHIAVRPAGAHRFTPAQTLERDSNASLVSSPVLLSDDGRGLLVAFIAQPGAPVQGVAPSVVKVAYGHGNRFAPPQTISTAGQQVSGLAGAEGPRGDIVAWSGGPNPPLSALGAGPALYAAVSDPLVNRLGPVQRVSPDERAELVTPSTPRPATAGSSRGAAILSISRPRAPGRRSCASRSAPAPVSSPGAASWHEHYLSVRAAARRFQASPPARARSARSRPAARRRLPPR